MCHNWVASEKALVPKIWTISICFSILIKFDSWLNFL